MAQFTLKSGRVLQTQHVNRSLLQTVKRSAIERFDADNEAVECPTYTVELLGGATKTYRYDAKSIQDADTDAERSAFAAYRQYELERERAWKQPFYELLLYQGVVENPEDDADWLELCEMFSIAEPEGKKERKIHWLENATASAAELQKLITHILLLPSEIEAEAKKASEGFRG